MKMKEFGPRGGDASMAPPLDPPRSISYQTHPIDQVNDPPSSFPGRWVTYPSPAN